MIFNEIVTKYPRNMALIWDSDVYETYADLDKISNQIANFLLDSGVKKGDRVCTILDKCTASYAIILACLKIGAPYFFVDPANPSYRTKYMVEKCGPKIAFIGKGLHIDGYTGLVSQLEEDNSQIDLMRDYPPDKVEINWEITGSDPAYIMFTSGSTGFPKGAVMSQNNLINFIRWTNWQFDFSSDDVFTNVNPLFFDNSVFDIYSSLFKGAALVPFSTSIMSDPYQVLKKIDEQQCTVYFSVPSLLIYFQTLKVVDAKAFKTVKKIIFGGEGYPKPKLKELYDCVGDRISIYNVYGPTECTCICSVYRISDIDFKDLDGYPPLGSLIPNFSYSIYNEEKEPVNDDDIGELYLSGPCVGLGYFNDSDQTREAFVQNPTNSSFHDRMYKTGDLIRYSTHDKKLYFSGRKDSQIKHQGYRIELAEIEHALTRIQGIDEAVALHSLKNGISTIIGVVATKQSLNSALIKKEVAKYIPRYMIPGKFEILKLLPKNPNGKIDRNLLKTTYG
ncbi:amino acid adenylation domain-containing protein [Thermodesulfobacteriota bacterium]